LGSPVKKFASFFKIGNKYTVNGVIETFCLVKSHHYFLYSEFTPAAREILDALLEKYADYEVGEFDHLSSVLQVLPFDLWFAV
jgi:hypothetical protein